MIQVAKSILLFVSALFPIVDPIGGSPIFLSLTRDYTPQTRRVLARTIAVDSLILLLASFTIGSHVLSFFGISLPVVQVGGGLIVISTGWAMLKQSDDNERGAVRRNVSCSDALRQAFYPLTLPLTVGPGSISIAITLGANGTASVALGLASHSQRRDRLFDSGPHHLSFVCLRRSVGRNRGSNWRERHPQTFRVPAGVYWRPDSLEWCERTAAFPARIASRSMMSRATGSHTLTRNIHLL